MTNNPFTKAEKAQLYLKLGVFGDTGTGKTQLALSFPKPAVIDTEGGTTAFRGMYDFEVLNTQSYKRIEDAFAHLASGKHDFQTLVVDPATILYDSIKIARVKFRELDTREGSAGQLTFQDWEHIKRIYNNLLIQMVNMPLNVVMTFREKDEMDFSDPNNPRYLGKSFRGEKDSQYWFDIWARMIVDGEGDKRQHALHFIKARGVFTPLNGKKLAIPAENGYSKIAEILGKLEQGTANVQYKDSVEEDVPQVKAKKALKKFTDKEK